MHSKVIFFCLAIYRFALTLMLEIVVRYSELPNFGPQKILCSYAFCSLYIKAGEFQYRVSLVC